MPSVTVTRRLRFNAAHRVYNPSFTDAENESTFGKCNNPNSHGHKNNHDETHEGPNDERTGKVIDLSKVKALVTRELLSKVDHKNMNLDVPFMQGHIPTSENIIVEFWKILEPALAPAKLVRLVLWETENNYVEYTGP
jgi:6-pyruvoyltetrahydropterin/6-carboxytetrahydropterin synthase